jgi:hypothetical protein
VGSHFAEDNKIWTYAPTASGTTTITQTTGLDMAGYEGCCFIVRLGSPAASNTLKVAQCDTSTGTYSDLASTATGSGSDTPLIVDVKNPQEQYLKYIVTRVGGATTIDTVVAIQYGAAARPVTHPGSSQVEKYHAPSEGTA